MNSITVTAGRFPFKVQRTVVGCSTGTATYIVFGLPVVTLHFAFDTGADVVEFLGRTSN